MNDYISRQAAIEVLCDACGNVACPKGMIPRCSYYDRMQSIPAADVQPVKRGVWKEHTVCSEDYMTCSNCWHSFNYCDNDTERFNYCPNCGADMRGGKPNE